MMSSYDHIAINADRASLADVAARIATSLSAPQVETDEGVAFDLERAVADLYPVDLVPANGVDWDTYPFEIRLQSRDLAAQESAAHAVYERLAAETPWALVLSFDERLNVEAVRPALERA
jgi:hypothetical protein